VLDARSTFLFDRYENEGKETFIYYLMFVGCESHRSQWSCTTGSAKSQLSKHDTQIGVDTVTILKFFLSLHIPYIFLVLDVPAAAAAAVVVVLELQEVLQSSLPLQLVSGGGSVVVVSPVDLIDQ